MWVKKTKEEIEKAITNKKKLLAPAIVMAVAVFALFIIVGKTGFSGRRDFDALTWNEIIKKVPFYLLISAGVFTVVYLFQMNYKVNLFDGEKTYVCDRCNNKKLDDGKYNCECGGEYIDINLMKWVEDEENDTEEPS